MFEEMSERESADFQAFLDAPEVNLSKGLRHDDRPISKDTKWVELPPQIGKLKPDEKGNLIFTEKDTGKEIELGPLVNFTPARHANLKTLYGQDSFYYYNLSLPKKPASS